MRSAIPKTIWAGVLALTIECCLAPHTRVLAGSDAEKRGQELFATKGCWHCHGQNGVGGGKGPDLQLVRKRRTRESMVLQIHDGGKQMPSFGDVLSSQEIDDLVTFLRAKRKVIEVPPQTRAEATQSAGQAETN